MGIAALHPSTGCYSTLPRHAPRRRGIQYPLASRIKHRRQCLLDHPHARVMTIGVTKRPLICPSGCFLIPLSSPFRKNISLFPKPKSVVVFAASRLDKRGVRVVTNVGRDAVDALATQDERRSKRTAKPCGPGAPTLALSFRGKQFPRK